VQFLPDQGDHPVEEEIESGQYHSDQIPAPERDLQPQGLGSFPDA
jgi:hypothetical protein